MYRIIYLSSAVALFSAKEIEVLLATSRKNNAQNDITGLLLYSDGNFLQILEGDKENVEGVFEKIRKDARHKNIITVIHEEVEERSFSDWKMGFSTIDESFLIKHAQINPFNFKNSIRLDAIVKAFIETFVNSFRNKAFYVN